MAEAKTSTLLPVGWQAIARAKITRRALILAGVSSPLAPKVTLAAEKIKYDKVKIEFDLSADGKYLTIREFSPSTDNSILPIKHGSWKVSAASFGTNAWFTLVVDPKDDDKKSLLIRSASFGAAPVVPLEFEFRRVTTGRTPPEEAYWSVRLKAPFGGNSNLSQWSSDVIAFRSFAPSEDPSKTVALGGMIDGQRADRWLSQVLEGLSSIAGPPNVPLNLELDIHAVWRITRDGDKPAVGAFSGRVLASNFWLGWYRQQGNEPFFLGTTAEPGNPAPSTVTVSKSFVVGQTKALHVSIDPTTKNVALGWDVRRLNLAVAAANPTVMTYAKLAFGQSKITIADADTTSASSLWAEQLFLTECRLPDQRFRNVIWGEIHHGANEADYTSISTVAGRLLVNGLAPKPYNVGSTNDASSAPADPDALAATGERSPVLEATIWAIFDRDSFNADAAARRIAVDLELHGSDLALPDVSRSALRFGDVDAARPYTDLRLLYEDGTSLTELLSGEFPRRRPSSFVWLGTVASGKQFAVIDLSNASLSAWRDRDLVHLRFRFLDLTVVLTSGQKPSIRPVHIDCRVVETEPGKFRDDRPVLVVEFDPQHIFEEAIFGQDVTLPDVIGPKGGELDRNVILTTIAGLGNDIQALAKYRQSIQDKKNNAGSNTDFKTFCDSYGNDPDVKNLPFDQQIYVGPFALDPDAMALARRTASKLAATTVKTSIDAMFDRVGASAATYSKTKPDFWLPIRKAQNGPFLGDSVYLSNALRNEATLEQSEPVYAVFRDFYRAQMQLAFQYANASKRGGPVPVLPSGLWPKSLDRDEIEYLATGNRPLATDDDPGSVRAKREMAMRTAYVANIAAADPNSFDELAEARLSDRTRLAFHINCTPPAGVTAIDAGLPLYSGAAPSAPSGGGFDYPPIAYSLEALTDWSRHEPAVTLRARKLFTMAPDGLVPPVGERAANLDDGDLLVYQGISRHPATSEQRLGEVRSALAVVPSPFETAIEAPARLILSTAQDAIWLTRHSVPWQVTDEERARGASTPIPSPSVMSVMKPGDMVMHSRDILWTSRLDIKAIDPSLRAVSSPDLRPNALTWVKPDLGNVGSSDVREIGQGEPPHGAFAPWFLGPEQMDETTLTAASVNKSLPVQSRIAPNQDLSDAELCDPKGKWRDKIWSVLRRLCDRSDARNAFNGSQYFRNALDAYDRHELVLLSSAYGLPVIGKRAAANSDPSQGADDDNIPPSSGALVPDSGQIEPGEDFALLDADGAQAIQRPQPLHAQQLELSALGAFFVHDTHFSPSAGADNLWGGKIFDGFSIERWRSEIVLGRDIVGEVVYKGYLFPLGHRASMVKLTERLFLKNEKLGVKAVLFQRIFLRVGRKTQVYPSVGQPFDGRLWCANNVTLQTVQTPDLRDPYIGDPGGAPENVSGGRINIDGNPGLAFWPRVNETDQGLVKFDLTIDGATSSMPLIFVDNIAATNTASLNALSKVYLKTQDWLGRRTVDLADQPIRYAPETRSGDCSLKTKSLIVSVTGQIATLTSDWIGDLSNYRTSAILEGAEQPSFYPAVETATLRLTQVERLTGSGISYVDTQYDGRYARFGFPITPADPSITPSHTNPLEIFLNLRNALPMTMAANGDRVGAIGRPAGLVVAVGRVPGPVSASGRIAYESTAPLSPDSHVGGGVSYKNVGTDVQLVDDPEKAMSTRAAFEPLVSLADFFDPEAHYVSQAVSRLSPPINSMLASRSSVGTRDLNSKLKGVRDVLKVFFSDDAKLLGIISFRELLEILGFDLPNLSDAAPYFHEVLQFGADVAAEANDDADKTTQFIHAQIVAPLRTIVSSFQDQWDRADKLISSQTNGSASSVARAFQSALDLMQGQDQKSAWSLSRVFPEISQGLADLDEKLSQAEQDDDAIDLALDLGEIYESAKSFAGALERIASNPVARLKQAAIAVVQEEMVALADAEGPIAAALKPLQDTINADLNAGGTKLKGWIAGSIPDTGSDRNDLETAATFSIPPPRLIDVAQAFEGALDPKLQAIQDQLTNDIRLDIRAFFIAVIDSFLSGGTTSPNVFIANLKGSIDNQISVAIKTARSAIATDIAARKPELAAVLTSYLSDFLSRQVAVSTQLPIALIHIYAAYEIVSEDVSILSQFRNDVGNGSVSDAIKDVSLIANQVFGIGDLVDSAGLGAVRAKLDNVFAAAGAKFDDVAAILEPSDTNAFEAEKRACADYRLGKQPSLLLPTPVPPATSGIMQPIDKIMGLLASLVTTVDTMASTLQDVRSAIDAAEPSGDYTRLIDDAPAFLKSGGPHQRGLIGEISELYCDLVRDLALLTAARKAIGAAAFAKLDKDLADTLLQYQHAVTAVVDNAVVHLTAIRSMITAFTGTHQNIVVVIGLSAAITRIGQISSATYKGLCDKVLQQEQPLAEQAAILINGLVDVISKISAFSTGLADGANSLNVEVVNALQSLGLDLDRQASRVTTALTALTDAVSDASQFVKIPSPLPATFADLLAAPIRSKSPVSVQAVLADPAPLFGDIVIALPRASESLVAEWRALQSGANGWPDFLFAAVLNVGAVKDALHAIACAYQKLLDTRNKAADTIDTPLLSYQARHSVFVAQAFKLLNEIPAGNLPDDAATLILLKANDRLAQEALILSKIAQAAGSITSRDDMITNFGQLANSWRAADVSRRAAPLQIANQIGDLASAVLQGEVLSLIDVSALRDAILDAIARLIPTKASLSYKFDSYVVEEPEPSDIFQASKDARFTLKAEIATDLLKGGDPTITTSGSLGPFAVKLVGDYIDAMTLHFGGVSFTSEGGSAPRFDVMYDAYDLGADLAFFSELGPVLSPSSGSPLQIRPLQRARGLDVGYDINLGSIGVGEVSIFNINFAVSAELPFTGDPALFKVSLGTALTPITISFLPYAGSGYFSIYAGAGGIIGFEASFLFGAGGSLNFGPLEAQVQIQIGAFVRMINAGGRNLTEIGGSFLASGQASIWIFHFSATLYIGLSQNISTGQMRGEAIFTFSFSCGLVDYHYSVTGHRNQQRFGSPSSSSAQGAQSRQPRILGLNPESTTSSATKGDITSNVLCLSEDWETFATYFDFTLV